MHVRKGFSTFLCLFPAKASPILVYTYKIVGNAQILVSFKIITNPIIFERLYLRTRTILANESIPIHTFPIIKQRISRKKRSLRKLLDILDVLERLDDGKSD